MGSISCGASLIKYVLFAFNLIWLALGGVILYFGFKVTTFSGDVSDILAETPKSGALVLLVTGFVIFVIAFLGCCGAIKENSCMLSTYAGVILILVVIQGVGVYLAFKYHRDIEQEIKNGITDTFHKYNGTEDNDVQKAVNRVQRQFQCCGINNYTDWNEKLVPGKGYPPSCCDRADGAECPFNEIKFKNGCVNKLVDAIEKTLGGLGGVGIALVLIQLLIILSACCLAREVR